MPTPTGLTGGDKLQKYLEEVAANVSPTAGVPSVRVGFLENSTYTDGTSLPMVAATMEFGGRIEREPSDPDEGKGQVIYRSLSKRALKALESGVVTLDWFFDQYGQTGYLKKGRFIKASKANLETRHYVGAYVITIPPRPYFRNAIKANAPEWGATMGKILSSKKYNAVAALKAMGQVISGQIAKSITDLDSPPLAASTIAAKKSDKPLIDTGHMINSIDYEVSA